MVARVCEWIHSISEISCIILLHLSHKKGSVDLSSRCEYFGTPRGMAFWASRLGSDSPSLTMSCQRMEGWRMMKDEGRSCISKAQRGAHCMEAAPCHSGASKDRSVLVIILQENQTGLGNVGKLFYGISWLTMASYGCDSCGILILAVVQLRLCSTSKLYLVSWKAYVNRGFPMLVDSCIVMYREMTGDVFKTRLAVCCCKHARIVYQVPSGNLT